jgi:hypothetical protein
MVKKLRHSKRQLESLYRQKQKHFSSFFPLFDNQQADGTSQRVVFVPASRHIYYLSSKKPTAIYGCIITAMKPAVNLKKLKLKGFLMAVSRIQPARQPRNGEAI